MGLREAIKTRFLNAHIGQGASLKRVLMAMAACLLLSMALDCAYYIRNHKRGFSMRFAVSLTAMSMITLAFVLTIQSSIVVSLGMVGALSVVRYRMSVNSTMDMLLLVGSIALGIICGAGLYYIAAPMAALLCGMLLLPDGSSGSDRNKLLALDGRYPYDRARLNALLKRHARWHRVRSESIHNADVNLVIELHQTKDESALIEALRGAGDFHDVSLQVQEGVVDG